MFVVDPHRAAEQFSLRHRACSEWPRNVKKNETFAPGCSYKFAGRSAGLITAVILSQLGNQKLVTFLARPNKGDLGDLSVQMS